ncbi:MAG: alpha-2-macroglobulin family protein [Bacteroidota bacterium]
MANIAYYKRAKGKKYPEASIIIDSTTTTDNKGNFNISFVTEIYENLAPEEVYSYQYDIQIEITDNNGETQTATKRILVDNQSFKLSVDVARKNERGVPLALKMYAFDVNRVPVSVTGTVKVYKLKEAARVFRKRPWPAPEKQIISKDQFIAQFPHTNYSREELNRGREEKQIAKTTFALDKKTTVSLDTTTWEPGSYSLESTAYNESFSDSVTVKRTFIITDKSSKYLVNNALFDYEIVNSNYKNDGYVNLKLATALRDETLHVYIQTFYQDQLLKTQIASIEEGSKTIKVPVYKIHTDKYTIRLSYTKFNDFYKDEFSFELYDAYKFLTVKTETFRNRLQPGQQETWRFTILDLEQNPSNAEVLASMYDESLDQFKTHEWKTNISLRENNRQYAPFSRSQYFKTTHSSQFYNVKNEVYIPNFKNYLRFNWFGLNLKDINQSNFNYIQNLARLQNTTKKNRVYGKITGHVLDESGLPLPGASIVIKGSAKGVTTDFDGFYSIDAASDDILIISYLGYKSEKITVGFRNNINTQLRQGEALGEVTVVAYAGSHGKVASAVATLTMNGQSIQQVPIGDLGEILQGMAAGVSVTTGSGTPGQSATIIIRGRSSSQDDPEPLFVIDGVPVDQNVFRNLSDKNITSLRVLKDDPAMALYGSRGAGGVVIVTTKYGTRTELIDGVEVIVGITEEDLDVVKTRKNLKETAFFYPHLRTDANGAVAVTFDVPESLTRWKFQLFAHQKDGLYEMITKNAVTQKELMVVPNMPRFLREKDTIVISTKVINLQQKATNGIASLRLFNAHTMESIDAQLHLTEKNKRFSVDAKGNTQLSWKLYIPKGIDAIQYKVIATAGNFSDGEESVLPVLKNNILITEAKPIMVKAGEEKTVTFSKLTTNTSATLQQHQLTLEYTSNPTWNTIQSLPYLLEYPYECAEQTFARLYANLIAAHILQNTPKVREVFEAWKANGTLVSDLEKNPEFKSLLISETPWIRDAISETQQKQQLATLLDPARLETLQKEMWLQLKELQTASGGFPWFAGGADNYGITLHILQTFADLAKLKIVDKKTNARRYDEIITSAYSYADQRFLMAYDKLRKAPSDAKYRQQIEYIYTRSSTPDFMKTPENVTDAMLFYLESLRKNWMLTSVSEKAMVAMSLAKLGKRKDALKILKALEASAVKSDENGMYWKEVTEGRYSHTTATEIQALLIEAFAEITKDAKIVQELQLWLLQQKQRNQWKTTKATTKAIYALLLNPKLFVSIKDNTLITIGDKKIRTKKLDATAKEAGTGYLKTAWAKDEVTNEKATISIKNKGKTIGFGAAYWQYFEALDKVTQSEASTLQVSKELYVTETINNEKTLVPISKRALNIGDKITVRLTIRNAKDVEFIHLKDMRAAGLEPIDVLSGYKWQDGVGYYQSTRDASTNFFFDRIPAGVFIIEYELRVNATGDFSNGITTIESMYAPESRSYTKGSRIQVN